MSHNGQGDVPVGDIQLYEAIIPPLDDDEYKLVATQTLGNLPGDDPSPTIDQVTLKFAVRGPRFRLNPADIHSVFPPPSPPTPYQGQIPHVVVDRKTLPWERRLAAGADRRKPWLALLTVQEGDAGGIPKVESGTVGDLISVADGGKRPSAIGGPAIKQTDLKTGESLDDPCSYIDLPAGLFGAIAPRFGELPLLAHARGVNTGNKPIEGILADGIYSVIVGNRVVHESDLNGAFLVSLEGFQELLTGTAPSGVATVRLAVLYSWLFQMGSHDPFDFLMSAPCSGLLAVTSPNVACDATGTPCTRPPDVAPPKPDRPATFAADTVRYALQSGYAALGHDLREGSRTFSWYRGPLIPYRLELGLNPDKTNPVFRTADELLRYNPDSGLFDTSYAAAFQLGRLLALQNEAFLSALRAYLHEIKGQGLRLASRKALAAVDENPLELPTSGRNLMRNGVVLDATARWLAVNATKTLNAVATNAGGGDRRRTIVNRKSGSSGRSRLSGLHDFLASEANRAEFMASVSAAPDTVLRWLANLVLLTGVPFEYLVPDERMLPPETVRFFFLDENWIERLIAGTLSLVGRTNLDQLITDALRTVVQQNVSGSIAASVRPRLLGAKPGTIAAEKLNWPLTGFLIRSAVVDHWKGIVIENTSKHDRQTSLATLRLDRPAQGVLLGLYNGELGSITFKHPPESLHFGIDDPRTWTQKLRSLDTGRLDGGPGVEIKFHDQARRVIDVCGTANTMNAALKPVRFTSAELALEMIESPKSVTFEMLYP